MRRRSKFAKFKHVSIPIKRDEFAAGRLQPLKHSLEGLTRALQDHVQSLSDTHAPLTVKSALTQLNVEGPWSTADLSKKKLSVAMHKSFEVLDTLIFGGLLKKHCVLSFRTPPFINKPCAAYCCTYFPSSLERLIFPSRKTRMSQIVIYERIYDKGATFTQTVGRYQNALLHEMLHAYFEVYACDCNDCFKKKICGTGGHFKEWQEAGKAIEQTKILQECWIARSPIDREAITIDLGRHRSMAWEVIQGHPLPSIHELARLRLDVVKVQQLIKNGRAILAEHEKKQQEKCVARGALYMVGSWRIKRGSTFYVFW